MENFWQMFTLLISVVLIMGGANTTLVVVMFRSLSSRLERLEKRLDELEPRITKLETKLDVRSRFPANVEVTTRSGGKN